MRAIRVVLICLIAILFWLLMFGTGFSHDRRVLLAMVEHADHPSEVTRQELEEAGSAAQRRRILEGVAMVTALLCSCLGVVGTTRAIRTRTI
jgi:hypothetical protein